MRLDLLATLLLPLGALAIPNPALDAAVSLASINSDNTLKPRANGKPCGGRNGGGGSGWTGQGWAGGGGGGGPPAGIPGGEAPTQPEILGTTERRIGQKTVTLDPPAQPTDPVPAPVPAPAPSPAPAPQPQPESQPETQSEPPAQPAAPAAPASDGKGMDQAAWIAAHTAARAKYGQGPVGWSTAAEAQAQANVAAHRDSCNLEHTKDGEYGENLMAGSGGNGVASAVDTVGSWMSEGANFDYSNPDGNHGGKVVGHFTAIVWKTVKNVGCAVGTCGGSGTYIACCYDPTPNYVGQNGEMVPRPV